jgi:hypothetical protein
MFLNKAGLNIRISFTGGKILVLQMMALLSSVSTRNHQL